MQGWLDLESAASVEITSEDNAFPIEFARLQGDKEAGGKAHVDLLCFRVEVLSVDEIQQLL